MVRSNNFANPCCAGASPETWPAVAGLVNANKRHFAPTAWRVSIMASTSYSLTFVSVLIPAVVSRTARSSTQTHTRSILARLGLSLVGVSSRFYLPSAFLPNYSLKMIHLTDYLWPFITIRSCEDCASTQLVHYLCLKAAKRRVREAGSRFSDVLTLPWFFCSVDALAKHEARLAR